ncbi:MAG: hypothetical protein V3T86_09565 [Planctomycetota bacterium]
MDSAPPPPINDPALDGYEYSDADSEFGGAPPRFDVSGPPPIFITRERAVKGLVFGGIGVIVLGAALGAVTAALDFAAPAVTGLVLGFAAAAGCRHGFRGRSVPQTRVAATMVAVLCVVLGFTSMIAGGWVFERTTAERVEVTRQDLDMGVEQLVREREMTHGTRDKGERILLDQRIGEAERLRGLTDPQIEDYLWVQQAGIGQPLIAYAKLRGSTAPIVRLGPGGKIVMLDKRLTAGLWIGEILLAAAIAVAGVLGPRR